jgi:hypothetical protein
MDSFLTSLSEAGRNDAYHPVSGPLPSHVQDGANRIGTRPTPCLSASGVPNCPSQAEFSCPPFQRLEQPVEHLRMRASSIRKSTIRFEVCQGLAVVYAARNCGMPRDLQDTISVQIRASDKTTTWVPNLFARHSQRVSFLSVRHLELM